MAGAADAAIIALIAEARATRQRRGLIIAGDPEWTRAAAQEALAVGGLRETLWIIAPADAPIGVDSLDPADARNALGREADAVIVDLHAGLDPDALGAVGGVPRGGGLLVLLTPPVAAWPTRPDPARARLAVDPLDIEAVTGHFPARFAREWIGGWGVVILQQEHGFVRVSPSRTSAPDDPNVRVSPTRTSAFADPNVRVSSTRTSAPDDPNVRVSSTRTSAAIPERSSALVRVSPTRTSALADRAEPATDTDCLTADQAAAVAAVLRVARGRRRRPAVLTSDRGRGKSAALGIAVGRLLAEQPEKRRDILLVAPTLTAVGPVFAHAGRLLGARPAADGTLTGPGGTLRFAAPAELVGPLPEASLVLIDEAAALPLPLLSRLLAAPRVVFATTVHGYEGTGRGFAVRFRGLLDRETPGWRAVRLETPLRWAPNDPIEHTLFRALLLDATPAEGLPRLPGDVLPAARRARAELPGDGPALSALFGLLISA
ncbi:MAG: tRNA(Met) cytidine acetyltransferase, partial [Myxococcales bacterium]|nr:tRNA(Met) cytidine acetyltransferase [Myxococcales bacterium]